MVTGLAMVASCAGNKEDIMRWDDAVTNENDLEM